MDASHPDTLCGSVADPIRPVSAVPGAQRGPKRGPKMRIVTFWPFRAPKRPRGRSSSKHKSYLRYRDTPQMSRNPTRRTLVFLYTTIVKKLLEVLNVKNLLELVTADRGVRGPSWSIFNKGEELALIDKYIVPSLQIKPEHSLWPDPWKDFWNSGPKFLVLPNVNVNASLFEHTKAQKAV